MKLCSFNVNDGRSDSDGLLTYIGDLSTSTDIFCFQESYYSFPISVPTLLDDFSHVRISKIVSSVDTFGQHTCFRQPYQLLNHSSVIKENNAGSALHTELSINGCIVHVVNVHGISKPIDKLDSAFRIRQTHEIIEHTLSLSGPIIICGDFNLLRDTSSIKLFDNYGFSNLIVEYQIETTRNPQAWIKHPGNMQFDADYIFVNKFIKVNSFNVPFNNYSDHLPMILDFELVLK